MLAGFVLVMLGWLAARYLSSVAGVLGLAGLALLLAGYALSIARAHRRPPAPLRRGQVIRFSPRISGSHQVARYRWWRFRMALRRWLRLP